MNKLAIIIPVFNEEKNIEKLIFDWMKEVSKFYKKNFKIIIINDGSFDNTHNKIKKIKNKSILYINQKNIGHGNTCFKGYKLAIKKKYDLIFQIDSDNQCDPKYFKHFVNKIGREDAVFGNRITREDGIIRVIFSKILSVIIFLRTFVYVTDSNVPYRMIKRRILEKVIKRIPTSVELKNVYLSYLIQKYYKIHWININFRKRLFGKTKYNFGKLAYMVINLLFKLK
tara:strand:+ start:3876 stop:4556 length:681 start_codon:yes stop_codon:yes gene_type:complete